MDFGSAVKCEGTFKPRQAKRESTENPFEGGDFWWRGGGRIASELILGFGAKRVGEDGFRKEDVEKMSCLINRDSRFKNNEPDGSWWDLQVCH